MHNSIASPAALMTCYAMLCYAMLCYATHRLPVRIGESTRPSVAFSSSPKVTVTCREREARCAPAPSQRASLRA